MGAATGTRTGVGAGARTPGGLSSPNAIPTVRAGGGGIRGGVGGGDRAVSRVSVRAAREVRHVLAPARPPEPEAGEGRGGAGPPPGGHGHESPRERVGEGGARDWSFTSVPPREMIYSSSNTTPGGAHFLIRGWREIAPWRVSIFGRRSFPRFADPRFLPVHARSFSLSRFARNRALIGASARDSVMGTQRRHSWFGGLGVYLSASAR